MKKNLLINEMLINNVHIGHRKNLLDQSMRGYVLNINKKIHIINLEITIKCLYNALDLIKNINKEEKKILIVCIEKNTKKFVEISSKSINMPYINKRWLCGGLTNFKTLKSSVHRMNYIKLMLENKNFKMNKKRRRMLEKRIKRSKSFLEGVEKIKKRPDFIFIINVKKNKNALKESKKMNIPSIAIVDTNQSIKNIDYVIPGNDKSYKSIIFYIKKIIQTIRNG